MKRLYATAFRCGKPGCKKPLYKMNNETGEWILNSNVAHIHARSEGGPRWNPEMTEEENRSAENLMPLCREHAAEIDATPEHYPPTTLREWKQQQLAEYHAVQKAWPINDDEATEVAAQSFGTQRDAATAAGAAAVAAVARYAGRLVEISRRERRAAADAARAWREMNARWSRSIGPLFDLETGERLKGDEAMVRPPQRDTEQCWSAVQTALRAARTAMEPVVTDLMGELGTVKAVTNGLGPWCDRVERATRDLMTAATSWDMDPSAADDRMWCDAVAGLEQASRALGAACRGESAEAPPPQRLPSDSRLGSSPA
ncbi:HNH endonuclease signature motif containing protein [Streptomyces atratus]|uniref:HNH endonuclease signature motif containing protein n=1 Tax=Streptomyces atratus TaxID=1893 RepID=UPI0021A3429B|nr:HNH endonuclease signature motif containing protein [Streptomyces atratus]MCT2547407.1 HNH endonuclease [Streptomyces atratus]